MLQSFALTGLWLDHKMRKNTQLGNSCCRFIEVVDKLPQCPCDCIPPIPTGPPCPFKPASGQSATTLQNLLQQPIPVESCILKNKPAAGQPAQLCLFSRPDPIDFKAFPRFSCTCSPGTCPEVAKNVIRLLGFDPMCACPCPHTVQPTESESVESKKKHKRKKKDRTKSSTDESPSAVSSATENETTGSSSAVQSASVGSPAGGPITSAAGETAKDPQSENQEPKYSANSGSSNGSLFLEGKGFKIFEIDGEKVLFNYSTKNCPLLKCKCSRQDQNSCGCTEWARLTKYKNCVCPGARKFKKGSPVPVLQFKGSN